jgi:hypothetical protein
MIIAAHAGTGKTTLALKYPDHIVDFVAMPYKYHLPDEILSSDEIERSKADLDLIMKNDWPFNYVDAIIKALDDSKILLIPPIRQVLIMLECENIYYTLCYPQREAKEVYRQRYINRGNSDDFLHIFVDGWYGFMDVLEKDEWGEHIVMKPCQFLEDVVDIHKMLS